MEISPAQFPIETSSRWTVGHSGNAQMQYPTGIQIVRRAYQLWEQAGKPEGRDEEFYHEAERQLKSEEEPKEGSEDI